MALSVKEIKKIAAFCRKEGITHFKCADYEFTLNTSHIAALPRTSKAIKFKLDEAAKSQMLESEPELTEEDLLFYSAGQGF